MARARATLTSKVRRLPTVVRLLDAITSEVQLTEDTHLDLQLVLDPAQATGVQLDRLGKLVGERRRGLTDEVYRRFVLAASQLLVAQGTVNEVTRLVRTLTAGSEVTYSPGFPAGYMVHYLVPVALSSALRERIKARVIEGTPAGVEAQLVEGEETLFIFDESTFDGPDGLGYMY